MSTVPAANAPSTCSKARLLRTPYPDQAVRCAPREKCAQALLDLFRASPHEIDVFGVAFRAGFRDAQRKSTIVAKQPLAPLVIREGDAAILAQDRGAATPAKREKRISAAVDQHQRLRTRRQPRGNRGAQALGDRPRMVRLPEILPQIHDLYGRHGPVLDARIETQKLVLALAGMMKSLERRCRGSQQHDGALQLGAHDGYIAPVVTRRFFLLVTRFLLLVDDDQAQIFERRENSRTRAHHDARFASPHPPPFAGAIAIGKRAVQYRHSAVRRATGAYFARRRLGAGRTARAQPAHPKCQRDFRNQHQRGTATRQRRFDRLKVHFGFAAPGDPEKHASCKYASIQPR